MPFSGAHDSDDGGGDDGDDGGDDGGDNRGSGGGRVMSRILQGDSLTADTVQSPDPVQVMRDRIEALKQEKERLQKVKLCFFVIVPLQLCTVLAVDTDSPSFTFAPPSHRPTAPPPHYSSAYPPHHAETQR